MVSMSDPWYSFKNSFLNERKIEMASCFLVKAGMKVGFPQRSSSSVAKADPVHK